MVRIGTCSWKYPSWHPTVYATPEPENFLREYAEQYNTVEIDQWFWSLFGPESIKLPDPGVAVGYALSVDEEFRFTIKAPNSITLTNVYSRARKHAGTVNPHFLSPKLTREFLETIKSLQTRCDAIMFQFEYLNRQKMSGADEFCSRLGDFFADLPDGWPYAVELRNPNFMTRPYFKVLYDHGIANVFAEGYYLPPVTEIYRHNKEFLIPRAVLRLLGSDRDAMDSLAGKRWDRRLLPKDERLEEVATMIQDMVDRSIEVTVNVNNHYEGSAPATIEALRRYLGT